MLKTSMTESKTTRYTNNKEDCTLNDKSPYQEDRSKQFQQGIYYSLKTNGILEVSAKVWKKNFFNGNFSTETIIKISLDGLNRRKNWWTWRKNRKFPIWTTEKTDWKQTDRASVTQGRKTKVLILLPLESKKEGQCGARKNTWSNGWKLLKFGSVSMPKG